MLFRFVVGVVCVRVSTFSVIVVAVSPGPVSAVVSPAWLVEVSREGRVIPVGAVVVLEGPVVSPCEARPCKYACGFFLWRRVSVFYVFRPFSPDSLCCSRD